MVKSAEAKKPCSNDSTSLTRLVKVDSIAVSHYDNKKRMWLKDWQLVRERIEEEEKRVTEIRKIQTVFGSGLSESDAVQVYICTLSSDTLRRVDETVNGDT